jgi:hypothetical protein
LSVGVFLDPITQHFAEDRLFEQHHYGDYHMPFLRSKEALEARGYHVHTADYLVSGEIGYDVNVYISQGNLTNYRKLAERDDVIRSALFHFESPIVHPSTYRKTPAAAPYFRRIYSFTTPQELEPFGCGDLELEEFRIPSPYAGFDERFDELWQRRDRKFLCMINQNKLPNHHYRELFTERLVILEHFAKTDSIDLYGIGWDVLPFKVGERRMPRQLVRVHREIWHRIPFLPNHPYEPVIKKVWRGQVDSKHETMSGYTFAFAYENMELDGWINEKIFDPMLTGAIPIFRGAPNVRDYIPEECFIDGCAFSDYQEMEDFLRSLSPKEIEAYREAGRAFIESDAYYPFTSEAFAEIVLGIVEADVGVEFREAEAV